jgi:hypothetical protein
MTLLLAQTRYLLYRHGWPLAAGVVLALLSLALYALGVVPMREQVVELRLEQQALVAKRAQPEPSGKSLQGSVEALNQRLTDEPGTLAAIATLHEAARIHGVVLARGEYRVVKDTKAPWQRYQITLPARGAYPAVRSWLAEVMQSVPGASLDELGLRRELATDPVVEARVRLTIYRRLP